MENGKYMYLVGATTTLLFFILGYTTGYWDKVWVVFLLNPIVGGFIYNYNRNHSDKPQENDELNF